MYSAHAVTSPPWRSISSCHIHCSGPSPSSRTILRQYIPVIHSAGPNCRASFDASVTSDPVPQHKQLTVEGQVQKWAARRQILVGLASSLLVVANAQQAEALPLAPLGPVERVGGDKRVGMSPEEVKDVLARDLEVGMYFVTGDLTKEIFADDCRFVDPTNDVQGLSKYVKALSILFDPAVSAVRLESISVTGPNTIEADWRLGGYLKFPWNPRVEALSGHTVYTLDPATRLIVKQSQTWSISALEALKESFTPTTGPRTPVL